MFQVDKEHLGREWYEGKEDICTDSDDDYERENLGNSQSVNDHLLYRGSQLSVAKSVHASWYFMIRHNLSGECISDLLNLIQLHCSLPND